MSAKTPTRAPINGEVLRWARQIGGISIGELAKVVGREGSPDIIQEWEEGDSLPTARQLEAVANKLKRPISVFFLSRPPVEPDPTTTFRRTVSLETVGFSSELRLAIRTARYVRDVYSDVFARGSGSISMNFPTAIISDDTDMVADTVRTLLGVSVEDQMQWPSDEAYSHWQEILFENGIIPQQFSVPKEQAWGFSIADGPIPVVAVNSKVHHKVARTFTLWHEVGHVLLKESSVSVLDFNQGFAPDNSAEKLELWCNKFAASFLLPKSSPLVESAMRGVALDGDFSAETISRRATKFKVSKYVFLGRLFEYGLINQELHRELRRQWWQEDTAREEARLKKQKESSSGGIPPWQTALSERTLPVTSRVLAALSRGVVDDNDASRILGLSVNHLQRLQEEVGRREARL